MTIFALKKQNKKLRLALNDLVLPLKWMSIPYSRVVIDLSGY